MIRLFKQVVRKVRGYLMRGDDVCCPLCGGHFRRFMVTGSPTRHGKCPQCGSLERHRILWFLIEDRCRNAADPKKKMLLHVAPEHALAPLLMANFKYLSVDLDGRNAMRAMDITSMPIEEETFDAVMCNHVLEHVPDDRKALSEIFRVLKKGGWASIQVPIKGDVTDEDLSIKDPEVRRVRYGQADHVRQYGKDFKERLLETGFELEVFDVRALGEVGKRMDPAGVQQEIIICRKPLR